MKTIVTRGIVLSRTNFGEADRIVTLLTPDQGKVRVVAKGVRRQKSKMAGGIELFSVGDITFMAGRGELGTLISSRVLTNYPNIVKDINRTMYGYELLKLVNKITEDPAEQEYFDLLQSALAGLDNEAVILELNQLWATMRLLQLTGHTPNLESDTNGKKLREDTKYVFSFDDMAFAHTEAGQPSARLIKVLRLSLSAPKPDMLLKIKGAQELTADALQLATTMSRLYLGA